MKRPFEILVVSMLVAILCGTALGDSYLDSPFSMGVGARDLALSGSASANCDPVYAPFWNASVLARAQRISFGVFHSTLYDPDVVYQYFGLSLPTMDYGTLGVGIFRLGVSGIERRDDGNFLLGDFDDSRVALNLAYARRIAGYDAGIALTLERHSLDSYKATSSPGLNLSISRSFGFGMPWLPELTAGFNARNILRPSIKILNESIKYPYEIDASLAVRVIPQQDWRQNLLITTGINKEDMIDPKLSAGMEYSLYDLIHLRASMKGNNPSFGMGISYKSFNFDYALVERDMGSLHMFGITTSFGATMDTRRILREQKRERQFNEMMTENLKDKNFQIVAGLFARADSCLESGDYNTASAFYERGLFIAQANGLDTCKIYVDASESKDLINEIMIKQNFENMMDSARVNLASANFVEARYYVDRALDVMPDSRDAASLLADIETRIKETATTQSTIESRLILADSLLNYGEVDKAMAAISSIEPYASSDARISAAMKRARFEELRKSAQHYFEAGNMRSAKNALDSADLLFPNHPWCLDLRQRIKVKNEQKLAEKPAAEPVAVESPLSEEMLNEVKGTYDKGRKQFEGGQLENAIVQWEKVEKLAPDYMSVREYLINAYKFLGVELYGKNNLADAVAIWKKAANLDPENKEIASYIKRTEAEIAHLQELTYEPE